MNSVSPLPEVAGLLLARARTGGTAPLSAQVMPPDAAGAYAIQDATLRHIGPTAGWKVGAKGLNAEPQCAPLPASGILASGVALAGPSWQLRGVEVEVAVRLGRDLVPGPAGLTAGELVAAVDAVFPAVELVETRLADWKGCAPLAQLADLQSHGALVLGEPASLPAGQIDLRTVAAELAFDGQVACQTVGGNPAADLWRLLQWLAVHCAARGQPLRAGQVITTGSCTGMLFAPPASRVTASLAGIGTVHLQF